MENKQLDISALKSCLDKLALDYGAAFLDTDPVGLIHRYSRKEDVEVSGFLVSALSYGGAKQIRKTGDELLAKMGENPAEFAESLDPAEALEIFRGIQHRWTTPNEIAFLAWISGEMLREHGSIGGLVRSLDNATDPTIERTIAGFSKWIFSRWNGYFGEGGYRKAGYLFPSPEDGSACKRPAMFFRWMVRGPDGIDFGFWRDFISPARLVVPLDFHMTRMARRLGFTKRTTAGWKTALEVTESLKCIDPDDPLKYDFALVRPGILKECAHGLTEDCPSCNLETICRKSK
jgi:uncharacterized protein (TIGR02757 family)